MEQSSEINFKSLFESAPGLYLILKPDLTIVAVSDAYLQATMTERKLILGKGLFEVFPDNPDDPDATGVSNLRASLNSVLQNKTAHSMAVQKYDIRRPDGSFEERYWSPLNKPVFNEAKELTGIIHRVEDVTEFVKLKSQQTRQIKQTEELMGKVQEMEMETFRRSQEIQEMNSKLVKEIEQNEKSRETLRVSQQMFSTIFFQSPVINTITDAATGNYIEVNDNFSNFFGLAKKDIIGKNSVDLNIIPEVNRRTDVLDVVKKQGTIRDIMMDVKDKSGQIKHISISVDVVNIDGRDCFLTAMIDVTERIKAEERLKASEALIRVQKQNIQDFIDSMSTLCAKVSTGGRFLMVNKTALRASGLSMEALLEINFLDGSWWSYNGKVQARVREAFIKACSGEAVSYEEDIFVFGKVLAINFSMIPVRDADDKVDYIICEATDISSLKQTEDILQKKKAELEDANKELESFSYSVSHDLRAPLRIIHGYTEIIMSDYSVKMEDEGKRMLAIVNNNVRKMGQLIDDLLNLSRLGRKELNFHRVNMQEAVQTVVEELKISGAKMPQLEIGKLEPVQSDESLLQQVWFNLIANAVKYSRTKEDPRVEINSFVQDHEIIYSVRDNGVGFNMKYAGKLFGVFQRLHKMNEFEGTGVGLALVHRIVTRLGGKVWAEAEIDKGASFFFSLPKERSVPSKDQQVAPVVNHSTA